MAASEGISQRAAGLRPVPQERATQAAGAALRPAIRAHLMSLTLTFLQTVFDGHSTQSLIATRLRREGEEFKDLPVDKAVYGAVDVVDKREFTRSQLFELARLVLSTAGPYRIAQ